MTEKNFASSDATNIGTRIIKTEDSKHYIVNGRKWWITGAGDPRCKVALLMGKTNPKDPNPYKQQSIILVPFDAPGVRVVRPLKVYGLDDAPSGHCEVHFENVKVPAENIILGEGRGFEIAQQRLGPGRIHHMMRLIGMSERALEQLCARADSRFTFGKPLSNHGIIQQYIALSRVEIEQSRLLVLKTAYLLDKFGSKGARKELSMVKYAVPQMASNVVDRAIQIHGAGGFSDEDFGLAHKWVGARSLRVADGPDEVHLVTIAKLELSAQKALRGGIAEHIQQPNSGLSELDAKFLKASQSLSKIPSLGEEDVVKLYGIYKQATAGDASETETPAKEDMKGLAKYNSWKSNKGLTQEQAKQKYVQSVYGLAQRSKM